MSYQRLSASGEDGSPHIPASPPPSFRSRASSATPHERQRLVNEEDDRMLDDTFESPSDDEEGSSSPRERELDERQRAMSGRPNDSSSGVDADPSLQSNGPATAERRVTRLPIFAPAASMANRRSTVVNDGVFANLNAKLSVGEDAEEKPPSYEQAAADATPPYWETSILAPASDEVFIDGLPVGSLFSFVWNGMISMSFQLVGFLLTYLLHTNHAAKNGSKAGLGITLIQYGFTMKGARPGSGLVNQPGGESSGEGLLPPPSDPNGHDFDPNSPSESPLTPGSSGAAHGMKSTDWFAYALMIVGWFLLLRSVSEYLKARRHEQLVMQSPSRGLTSPVVSEEERPETAV